ncbi:MAG TPA: group II intron reverse transcriptase/maturase [Planctomycetaceae bacterium]|nr:group II intron reverse transcriptase/maturase [Planctomycetaceae bacterium]HIK89294.1 group II intron reverse transcriptase/maturase [Dehalococcoidia bacterium]
MNVAKPFAISKFLVWRAYLDVKSKGGAAGVDKQSLEDFERDLKNNLYRIWNRMCSGSYFPPPVKAVPIPKKSGGTRVLGVPTISDRIAQTVVKRTLEPILEPVFDEDSYGYRPRRSAHDAIAVTRKRCWQYNWVVEFDIRGLFDNISHELLMKALRLHCKCRWVLLYVERWLKASMQQPDGTLTERHQGTPQGGVVSPVLANLFLHYAFDAWVRREMPHVPFCRYADDGLLHCRSRRQAEYVMKRITERFQECGLEIHPDKSSIVYCQDRNRTEQHPRISFDFLGYTFRPRRCVDRQGNVHPNFLPAISRPSKKEINRKIRSWHLQLKNEKTLSDLSRMFNPVLQGWLTYYGRFYPSGLRQLWRNINRYLVQWVRRKFKRFSQHKRRAKQYLDRLARANPNLFVHWKLGVFPCGSNDRSRMS